MNLAQRLEQLNKELKTICLICGTTFNAARRDVADAAPMGSTHVRGRDGAVDVFSIGGKPSRFEQAPAAPTQLTQRGNELDPTTSRACQL